MRPLLTANVCKLSLLRSDDVVNPQVGLTFSCRSEGIEGMRGVRQRENRLLRLLGLQGGAATASFNRSKGGSWAMCPHCNAWAHAFPRPGLLNALHVTQGSDNL